MASAAKRGRIVGETVYGSSKTVLTEPEILRFKILDFANLPQGNGQRLITGAVEAYNHSWYAVVFPRGCADSNVDMLSCFLECEDLSPDEKIKAKFSFQISPSITRALAATTIFEQSSKGLGSAQVATRQEVLESLVDGDLIIDIHLQIYIKPENVWYPNHNHIQGVLSGKKLLQSPISSDVSFSVGDEQEKVHAHKCILFQRAPTFYEFVKDISPGEDFQVPNIKASTFRALLHYVYTGEPPKFGGDDDGTEVSIEILLASDRFNLTLLKLHIESDITSKVLKPNNAAEWLFFADAHSCPLLKEACMNAYANNLKEVKASPGWPKIKESPDLLMELLEFCATNSQRRFPSNSDDYENMTVRMLRERLESWNLDLDGTREMLVGRLKNHRQSLVAKEDEEGEEME